MTENDSTPYTNPFKSPLAPETVLSVEILYKDAVRENDYFQLTAEQIDYIVFRTRHCVECDLFVWMFNVNGNAEAVNLREVLRMQFIVIDEDELDA